MKNIAEFFSRMRGKFAQEVRIRAAVQEAVRKNTGIEVPVESVSFSNRTIVLKGLSQSAKSAIFIKKSAILKEIGDSSIGRIVEEIRY